MQHGVGRATMAMSSAMAFSTRVEAGDRARQHAWCRRRRNNAARSARSGGRRRGTGSCDRRGSPAASRCRQREAERFGQAVHRVGGEHARARAAGRQAERSSCSTFSSLNLASAADTMASTRSSLMTCLSHTTLPASIGRRRQTPSECSAAARRLIIPGVILSQLEMHTSASAQCALTMYSTSRR